MSVYCVDMSCTTLHTFLITWLSKEILQIALHLFDRLLPRLCNGVSNVWPRDDTLILPERQRGSLCGYEYASSQKNLYSLWSHLSWCRRNCGEWCLRPHWSCCKLKRWTWSDFLLADCRLCMLFFVRNLRWIVLPTAHWWILISICVCCPWRATSVCFGMLIFLLMHHTHLSSALSSKLCWNGIPTEEDLSDMNVYMFSYSQAWCLNLEYSISGAAVAASWGSKVLNLCSDEVVAYMYPPMTSLFSVNIFAGKLHI